MAPDIIAFTRARSESINTDSLNSNFLQLGRSGGQSQRAVHPRRLPVNTVIHTTLVSLEPTTFWLLVWCATSNATDEVVWAGWDEPGGEWAEWGRRSEEGSWFHGWGDAYLKDWSVICKEEDTDGRARVTADEERVLHVDWTEIRLCR